MFSNSERFKAAPKLIRALKLELNLEKSKVKLGYIIARSKA